MKKFLAVVVLCLPAFGQAAYSGPWLYSGSAAYGASTGALAVYAALPSVWVDSNELTCGLTGNCYTGSPGLSLTPPAYTLTLGGGTYGGASGTWSPSAPCGLTTLTRYSGNYIGLWNAVNDVEGCRTSSGAGTLILGPPGAYAAPATGTGSGGLAIPQTNTIAATAPIIFQSTAHASLIAMPQPPCQGGLEFNLAISTAPGIKNPDCTGTNMYFLLGPTNYSGSILGWTTISVNTVTLLPITGSSSPQLVPLANGLVSPTLGGSTTGVCLDPNGYPGVLIDQSGNQECVKPVAYGNTVTTNGAMTYAGTGTCVSGNTACILTDTVDSPFAPWMVGLPVTVQGAGNANGTEPLVTNILSWQSSSQVSLVDSDKNTSGVSDASFTIGGNQVGLYGVVTKNHASGVCLVYNVVNGCPTGSPLTNGSGAFTLQNGTTTNVSAYNYAQYMIQLTSQASGSNPLVLCSPVGNLMCGNVPSPYTVPNSYIGPDHWEFDDLNVSPAAGVAAGTFTPINTGPSTITNATSSCTVQPFAASCYVNSAHNIHFNEIWAHGDWTSLYTGANSIVNGIDFSGCYYCSVTNFQVSQAIRPAAEGHCILAQGNTLKIDNGVCEGESSGIFAGGFGFAKPWATYLANTDMEIRRVDEGFRYDWLGMGNIPASNPNYPSGNWTYYRKNCHEVKEGTRILYAGIICGDTDNTGGQRGILFLNGTRNASGYSPLPINYNNVTQDQTVQNVLLHDSCNGFVDLGGRSLDTDGGGVSWTQQRTSISNVLGWGISESNPFCNTGQHAGMTTGGGSQYWNATIVGNGTTATVTAFASVDAGVTLTATGAPFSGTGTGTGENGCPIGDTCTPYTTTGSTTTANEALCGGNSGAYIFVYGFSNVSNNSTTSGFQCASSTTSSLVLVNPVGVSGDSASTAQNNGNPVLAATAAAQNAAVGFQVVDIRANEPVAITATSYSGTTPLTCTAFSQPVRAFSSHIIPSGAAPRASQGSTPWVGSPSPALGYESWTQSMAQVQYPSTVNTSDSTGLCLLGNAQGGNEYATVDHVGIISDAYYPVDPTNTPGTSTSNFMINHGMLDSYFLTYPGYTSGSGGWADADVSSPFEGTNTLEYNYDPSTMSNWGLAFPERPASDYTEFINNAAYPEGGSGWIGNTCSGSIELPNGTYVNGCSPPTNITFPTHPYCTGATYTASSGMGGSVYCMAFAGVMSASSMPLTLPDYHGFELRSDSPYHEGNPLASPDGSGDIGPNIPAIDGALLQNQYVCATPCGSPGPFPD